MSRGSTALAGSVEATHSKSELTRRRISNAARELFGARGFDGTSLRDIEDASGVNRGLISYHFGNKEDLWKAVIDSYFTEYMNELDAQREVLGALDSRSLARVAIRNLVRFSVRHPHLNKIMIQENLNPSWRQDWIIERYLAPIRELERSITAESADGEDTETPEMTALRYALIGACTMPFTVAPEIQKMHGIDVFEPGFVETLVDTISNLYLGTEADGEG